MVKTIKIGQIFEVDEQQFILGHTGYNEYNLVGITKYYYSPSPAVFHDNGKVEFSKEDMKQISINRFDDLLMLPQNIKMCDFFDELIFSDLELGQKFTLIGSNNDSMVYQKIETVNSIKALNLETYYATIFSKTRKVKLVV